jgi:hypothetical protein
LCHRTKPDTITAVIFVIEYLIKGDMK